MIGKHRTKFLSYNTAWLACLTMGSTLFLNQAKQHATNKRERGMLEKDEE